MWGLCRCSCAYSWSCSTSSSSSSSSTPVGTDRLARCVATAPVSAAPHITAHRGERNSSGMGPGPSPPVRTRRSSHPYHHRTLTAADHCPTCTDGTSSILSPRWPGTGLPPASSVHGNSRRLRPKLPALHSPAPAAARHSRGCRCSFRCPACTTHGDEAILPGPVRKLRGQQWRTSPCINGNSTPHSHPFVRLPRHGDLQPRTIHSIRICFTVLFRAVPPWSACSKEPSQQQASPPATPAHVPVSPGRVAGFRKRKSLRKQSCSSCSISDACCMFHPAADSLPAAAAGHMMLGLCAVVCHECRCKPQDSPLILFQKSDWLQLVSRSGCVF